MVFNKKAFTLIELLIVVGILVALSVVVVLVINPVEMTKKARDARRLEEIANINKALNIATVQGVTSFGSPNIIYVSLPDDSAPTSTCPSYSLPSLPTGWAYRCSNSANYRKVNGSGWVPVDFASLNTGSPLSILPVDPINSISAGNYYTYVTGGSWELTTILESDRYSEKAINDGDAYPGVYSLKTSQFPLTPGIRDKGMVGYWKMDETSGTLYDSSGYGNNGTQSGGVTYGATGKVGNALGFDGVDDYVNAGNKASLNITNAITIAAWVYPVNVGSTARNIVAKNANSAYRFRIEATSRKLWLLINDGVLGFVQGQNAVSENAWSYVVAKFIPSEQNVYFYINGVLDRQVSIGKSSIRSDTGSLLIGAYGVGSEIFNGSIDDLRIYNRALSAAEIAAIYNATK